MLSRFTDAMLPALIAVAIFTSVAHASSGFSVLYNFCPQGTSCIDGANPVAGLIANSSGNLYGTTRYGGTETSCSAVGCGTIFKIAPDGTEFVLYSFCQEANCADGDQPLGALTFDKAGNLYGTASQGAPNGGGTVFRLAPDGKFRVLHAFCSGCYDGEQPDAAVIVDGKGNIFGTAPDSGGTCGVVFKIDPRENETIVHSFGQTGGDGCKPEGGLLRDSHGNFFGVTSEGGTSTQYAGTIYEIASDGSYSVLYSFCSQTDCRDGASPLSALTEDSAGNLYGTTSYGALYGYGSVFEFVTGGAESVIYSFCARRNCADGSFPAAGLIGIRNATSLYGTTTSGGAGNGVVFTLSGGKEQVLHKFSRIVGTSTSAPVLKSGDWLYGTTLGGGTGGYGTVFRLGTKVEGVS